MIINQIHLYIQSIWYIGVLACGRGETVQVSVINLGPIQQGMAVNLPESQEGTEVLGADGKYTATREVIYPCVGNVLLGSGSNSSGVRLGIVGHVRGDEEEGGGKPYRIPKADDVEECKGKKYAM